VTDLSWQQQLRSPNVNYNHPGCARVLPLPFPTPQVRAHTHTHTHIHTHIHTHTHTYTTHTHTHTNRHDKVLDTSTNLFAASELTAASDNTDVMASPQSHSSDPPEDESVPVALRIEDAKKKGKIVDINFECVANACSPPCLQDLCCCKRTTHNARTHARIHTHTHTHTHTHAHTHAHTHKFTHPRKRNVSKK
jgi:hypothetical protein